MRSIFALLLPLALLAGCAAPPSSPVPEDTAQESSPSSLSPDDDAQDGTFFDQTLFVAVDGGRTLTLVAHCKETAMEGFSTYGTGSIVVLDGEDLLQTLNVGEGVLTLEENPAASSGEVYPTVFESFYLPTLEDLNFDGCPGHPVHVRYGHGERVVSLLAVGSGPGPVYRRPRAVGLRPWSLTPMPGKSASAAAAVGGLTTRTSMFPMSTALWSM